MREQAAEPATTTTAATTEPPPATTTTAVERRRNLRNLSLVLRRAVTPQALRAHLEALDEIARRNGGNRAAGTKGYDESAEYVYEKLRAAGYEVRYQSFPFRAYRAELGRGRQVRPTRRDLEVDVMQYSGATPAGGLTAKLAVVPVDDDGTHGCEASDFAGATYSGRIALVRRGTCRFSVKARNADAAGASGVVIYNLLAGGFRGTLGGPKQAPVPVVSVSRETGEALAADAAKGDVLVSLNVRATLLDTTTRNVIAELRGRDRSRVVMAGGHLDSVPEGPGLNDNGSGTMALLEIALQLAEFEPRTNVRFAFWGAEEAGLLGSRHYVSRLSRKERERILAYLNFDMIGSSNFTRFVYAETGDGDSPNEAIEDVFVDYLEARKLPLVPLPFGGGSDHAPFASRGIATGGLFTGAGGRKTEEQARTFGGRAGQPYDACYHERCDDLENVNLEELHELADAAAHGIATFAAKPSLLE